MCIHPIQSLKQKEAAAAAAAAKISEEATSSADSSSKPINFPDLEATRREHLFRLPQGLERWITANLLRQKDERNLGIFLVGLNILMTSVPLAAFLFYAETHNVLPQSQLIGLGIFYAVFHLKTYARSFILALHYITHCSIFNLQFRYLDHVFKCGICNLFGIPLGLYYPHHIAMHHAEDNMAPHDMSSTMDYDRSSKWNHFQYMLRFFVLACVELPYRLCCRGKYRLAVQCTVGYAIFFSTLIKSFQITPIASFFVLWFPWVVCSFSLMQGNFKEHIFVDPDDPHNNYKSAMTCINCPSNSLTFNTGYHVEHHEQPGLPWYKLPQLFLKNLDQHAEQDSFIFSGVGPQEVGRLVLFGRYEELAKHYVNIGQPQRSEAELIAEFKRRTHPVYQTRMGNYASVKDKAE